MSFLLKFLVQLPSRLCILVAMISCVAMIGGCAQSSIHNVSEGSEPEQDIAEEQPICVAEWPDEQVSPILPEDLTLWDRIRNGYAIPAQNNEQIQIHLKWYAANPRYMKRVSERAERYLYYIVDTLEANDMPLEIALLPIVESAFDPFAYSHGRAAGMWQFIPGTGKNFGLKQNWWYDGRRDITASTNAAVKYLTRLHNQFDGDWLLALAAYNTGEGNVAKAIARNKRAGKPTDFWSLKLPRETSAYVPQLLALAELVAKPTQHGLKLAKIPNKPYFEAVDIGSQIDLAQAADMAEIDIDDLYLLNPGFNRWATDPDGPHQLLVPVDKAENFIENLAMYNASERINWQRYAVKSGDSLISIAKKHQTTVNALKSANNLSSNLIRYGQRLLVPMAAKPSNHYLLSAEQRLEKKQSRSPKNRDVKVTVKVKQGDSFWKISRANGVSVANLAKWNGLAPKDTLKVGQSLVIWKRDTSGVAAALPSEAGPSSVIRKVAYRVRSGDSLARIAGKFNVSIQDIAKWNSITKERLIHPGQSLKLFVDITNAR